MTAEKKTNIRRSNAFRSRVWNARLFFEGVKRLRVIAFAVAILAVTASILIPVLSWVSYANQYERSCWVEAPIYDDNGLVISWTEEYVEKPIVPNEVNRYLLCIPLYVIPFLAPLFFFVLFSFLHKRKQSDFFHAIPYTRTCVFLSFTTAALAFVSAIAILSALLSGLIYAACPFTTYAFGELLALLGLSILSSAFLSSFMMLSLSVTGTAPTTLLLSALFALITRATCGLFCLAIEKLLIVRAEFYPFLSPYWYLPFRLFTQSTGTHIPPYLHVVPYTIVATLAIFTAAGLLYQHRRSEMAERSAPSRRMQSVFRCLFTLPFALLLTTLIILDEIDFESALVLFVVTLLAFYLYELITTRRVKNLVRATPWLGAVAGGAVAFALAFALFGACVHADIPEEKIASVSVRTGSSTSYESIVTMEIETSDERMIALIADALDETRGYSNRGYGLNFERYYDVTIRRTNGTVVKRHLGFSKQNLRLLEDYLIESEEYIDAFLSLPPADSITYLYSYTTGANVYVESVLTDTESYAKFMEILSAEYETLSVSDRLLFKKGTSHRPEKETVDSDGLVSVSGYSPFYCVLHVSGEADGYQYRSIYTIPRSMTQTINYLMNPSYSYRSNRYSSPYLYETYGIKELTSGTADQGVSPYEVSTAIFRDLATGEVDYDEGEVRLCGYGAYEVTVHAAKDEQRFLDFFARLAELSKENAAPKDAVIPVMITAELYTNGNIDYEVTAEAYSTVMVYVTAQEYSELMALIGISVK